jgi:hypothetical protein
VQTDREVWVEILRQLQSINDKLEEVLERLAQSQ